MGVPCSDHVLSRVTLRHVVDHKLRAGLGRRDGQVAVGRAEDGKMNTGKFDSQIVIDELNDATVVIYDRGTFIRLAAD